MGRRLDQVKGVFEFVKTVAIGTPEDVHDKAVAAIDDAKEQVREVKARRLLNHRPPVPTTTRKAGP